MTQEIKLKLEQAAKDYIDKWPVKFTAAESSSFFAGAETILENPSEWGLVHPHSQKLAEEVLAMESQLAKYREALEAIKSECDPNNPTHEKIWRIAFNATKEALKQED